MTAADKVNPLIQYFEQLYGPAILKDAALSAYLQEATLKHFKLGNVLEPSIFELDEKIILLNGKIRVLREAELGKQQTAFLLAAGDIWDLDMVTQSKLQLTVSSDEAVICTLPTSLVLENTILSRHWEAVLQKSIRSPESSSELVPPAHLTQKTETLGTIEAIQARVLSAQKTLGLTALLNYYQQPLLLLETLQSVTSLEALSAQLQTYGFKTQILSLNWNQLLNTDFPFLLEDETREFRWITGRKGNTLLSDQEGKALRYIPADISPETQYKALKVEVLSRLKAADHLTPHSFTWYIQLCFQTWILSGQMVLASILTQIFALGMPLFYMVIFDRVFGRQNLSTLDVMTIGIFALLLFSFFIKLLRSYILSHQLEMIDKTSIDTFLERLFNIPLSKASPQMLRAFSERFPDLIKVNQTIVSTFLVNSLDAIFSVFLVIFLVLLHAKLALISLASLIPIAILSFWTTPIAKKRALQFSQSQRQSQMKLSEVLENRETVHSLNVGNLLKAKVAQNIDDDLQKHFGARFDRLCGPQGQAFIASLGSIVTLYFGAHEVLQGEISYGVYMAINMMSRQVVTSIQKLFESTQQLVESISTMEQFKTLYTSSENTLTRSQGVILPTTEGKITVADLCFRYQADMPWALKDVSFEIAPGQKVVLTGKSGSGRTTLIRLLQRLYEPTSGYMCLDGFNLADIQLDNLRQHIGVAMQRPGIFAGTIKDNIALGKSTASAKEIIEAASLAQLDQFLLQSPQGVDSPVAPMGANLAGGQIARIALARILLLNPSILILDEALSACDPALNATIFRQILKRYQDATCIFVTDYLPIHQQADKIIVLNEGQLVEQGAYQDLLKAQGYYTLLHHPAQPVER